ncbi:MAG: hypothetical protein ACYTFI_17595, partial [Planctomycetota bacterium]
CVRSADTSEPTTSPPLCQYGRHTTGKLRATGKLWASNRAHDLESDPKLIEVTRNTLDVMQRWFDNNGDTSFFPAAAYVGYEPELIYQKLNKYITSCYRPNGLRGRQGHGAEKLSTIPNTVNMMLCSVHDDVMRVYPAWPMDKDARFANLRQFGAFLVGSELNDGKIQYVDVLSEKGRTLALINPWPGQKVSALSDGATTVVGGQRLILKTRPNQALRFTAQ